MRSIAKSVLRAIAAVVLLAATLFGVSSPASAAGSPDVSLAVSMPAEVLFGAPVPVSLTASAPTAGADGFNLTFTDVLPVGASFGASDPAPTRQVALASGETLLIWENVADLLAGASVTLDYTFTVGAPFSIGSAASNNAGAYANTSARLTPAVSDTGAVTNATGSDTGSASTTFLPFLITKSEPSVEGELLRGVQDHKTTYTLTVENNLVVGSSGFSIVDFLPAGLEFLGCTAVDNSTVATEEYPSSGRIDSTPHPPLGSPCAEPTSVTTVTVDPDGAGLLPLDVYTRVEWDSAALPTSSLAAGGSFSIDYAAAIPLRENVADGVVGDAAAAALVPPTDTPATANLDNNTGALTTDEQALTNYAIASGTTSGTGYTADDDLRVTAEDLSIHKGVNVDTFDHTVNAVWSFLVESSEYNTATGPIVVTDMLPDGLAHSSSTATISSGPTNNSDGTQTVEWTLPAFTAPSSRTTFAMTTDTLTNYRNGGTPVSSNDSWTNNVELTSTGTVITANDGTTSALALPDQSSASQSASEVTILKQVSVPAAGLTCGNGAGVTWNDLLGQSYGAGDRVCWRLQVNFPANLVTLDPLVKDFLPSGFTFESQQRGANDNFGAGVVYDNTDEADGVLVWDLQNADPTGDVFEVVVSTLIGEAIPAADEDILSNLMKFSFVNTDRSLFQLRDNADAEFMEPILAMDKSVSPETATGGDVVTYTVATSNSGDQDAVNAVIVDRLPTGIVCADITALGGAACSDPATGRSTLTWTGQTVPAGGSLSLSYQMTVPSTFNPLDQLNNSASVTSYQIETNRGTFIDQGSGPDDTARLTIEGATLTKSRATSVSSGSGGNNNSQATIGETVTYLVTAVVPEGTTTTDMVLSDGMPTGIEITNAVATLNGAALPVGFTFTNDANGFSVTFPTPYVNAAGSGDDIVAVTVTSVVTNIASNVRDVDTPVVRRNAANLNWDGTRNRNRGQNTTIVEPALNIDKVSDDADGDVEPGDEVEYTITVGNDGATAFDVVVIDTLSPDLIPITGPGGADVADGAAVAGGTWDDDTDTIRWDFASIGSTDQVLTYHVRIANPLVGGSGIVNSATVTGTSLAGAAAGERDAATADLLGVPGYSATSAVTLTAPGTSVVKTGTPGSATIGEVITYTVEATLPGGVIGFDAIVFDTLPAGLEFGALTGVTCESPGSAPCTPDLTASALNAAGDTGNLGFWIGDITTGSTSDRTLTLTYTAIVRDTASDGETLTNAAWFGVNQTNKTTGTPTSVPSAVTYDVQSDPGTHPVDIVEPSVTINKNVVGQVGDTDNRRATPEETLTFSVTVTNSGTAPAYDVVVSDTPDARLLAFNDTTLPAVGATNTDGDPSDGTLSWTIAGPIAANGGTATITYELTVPDLDESAEVAGFELSNTADVPSYFGVPAATRNLPANSGVTYAEYGGTGSDVVADTVGIELDLASLGNRIWLDLNNDGIQTPNEPGLDGIDLTITWAGPDGDLTTTGDNVTYPRLTATGGFWGLRDLPGGLYDVVVDTADLPAGLSETYDLDDLLVGPDSQWTGTLGEDEAKRDVDFGYNGSGSVGDTVWFDQDLDGSQNGTEPGVPGVVVEVTWAGPDGDLTTTADNVVYADTTDANGAWEVTNLPAGDFSVEIDPAGTTLPTGFDVVSDPDTGPVDGESLVTLTTGETNDGQDFGIAGTGSIGDTVYLDRSGDGEQATVGPNAEPGIENVTVTLTYAGPDGLLDTLDDVTFTDVTDSNGEYSFENLPPAPYRVEITDGVPAGAVNTQDPDDPATPAVGDSQSELTLGDGEINEVQDFGFDVDSSIGDRVWWDMNRDGIQDANEVGINGVEITVTYLGPDGIAGTDDQVFTTTTDGDGDWTVTDVPDGNYIVEVTDGVPAGMSATFDSESGIVAPDGSSAVTLTNFDVNQDFGYAGNGTIGDTLYIDADNNGADDGATDPRLAGVDVVLTWFGPDGVAGGDDDLTVRTTTDTNGNYLFEGLPEGEFSVAVDVSTLPAGLISSVDPDAGAADGAALVTLGAGTLADNLDQDFGLIGTGSIGDTVWFDTDGDGVRSTDPEAPPEPGIEGATVTLTFLGPDGVAGGTDDVVYTTTVADDGSYLFENLPAGEFTVEISNLPNGVTPTADPDNIDDSMSAVTLGAGEDDLDQNFGYVGSAGVGDFIWLDQNGNGSSDAGEPGIGGVSMVVTSAGVDGVLGTTDDLSFPIATMADGTYLLPGLPSGPTSVTYDEADLWAGVVPSIDAEGDSGAAASSSVIDLVEGEINRDQDFGVTGEGALVGTVFTDGDGDGTRDGSETGLGGIPVTVTFDGPDGDVVFTATTEPDGSWSIDGLPAGDYTITIDPADLPGDLIPNGPISLDATVSSGVTDAGDIPAVEPASIGDRVWIDTDRDGVQDAGEAVVAGVTVRLRDENGVLVGVTVTLSDGSYLFDDLRPGTYTVEIDMATVPADLNLVSDPDAQLDGAATTTVAPGDDVRTLDFGLAPPLQTVPRLPVTGGEAQRIFFLAVLLLGAGTALRMFALHTPLED